MSSCNVLLQCPLAMSSCNVLSQCPLATSSHDGYILLSYLLIVPRNRRWISTVLLQHPLALLSRTILSDSRVVGLSSCRILILSVHRILVFPLSRIVLLSQHPLRLEST